MGQVVSFPKARANRTPGRARPREPLAEVCQIGKWGVCTFTPVHRHHIVLRSQGGSDLAGNTLDVCGGCHDYAHSHRAEAELKGWIRSRSAL